MGMKRIKIILVSIIFLLIMPISVYAVPGCCSHHGGEAGCSGGRTVCSDGWTSPCACDGTSRSSNYGTGTTNSNKSSNSEVSIIGVIIASILGFGGLMLLGIFLEKADDNRKKRRNEKYRRLEEQRENELELAKETALKNVCEENNDSIENINCQVLDKITCEDLMQLVNSKSETIFNLFDSIHNNNYGYTKNRIFDELGQAILNLKTLTSFQNKCITYIIENRYITNDRYANKYPEMFLIALKNKHIKIINFIIDNCDNILFNYYNDKASKDFYNYLLDINDLELTKKISSKENFKISTDIMLLTESKNINIENKYKILSSLSNDRLNIEKFYNEIIDFNDENLILESIENLSKMDNFIEETAYYIIFELIKKQKDECISNILSKYKNIDLNKQVVLGDKKYDGLTPLTYACYRKSSKIVELFISYGVDCNMTDKYENSAIAYACASKSLKIVKLLYEMGNRFGDYRDSYIEEAIKENRSDRLPPVVISKVIIPHI